MLGDKGLKTLARPEKLSSSLLSSIMLLTVLLLSLIAGAFSILEASKTIPSNGMVNYGSVSLPFEDGFETANFDSWTSTTISSGETISVTDVTSHHGSYCAESTTDGSTSYETAYSYVSLSSSLELYARGYIKISELGFTSDGDRISFIVFKAGGNGVAYASVKEISGRDEWALIIRDGTGWASASSTGSPSLNQWYSVELHLFSDTTNGFGELYIDGLRVVYLSALDTSAFGGVDEVRFGIAEGYNSGMATVYGDCFEISTTYIGPETNNGAWAVIGPKEEIPAMQNIFWLFGNQSISYVHLYQYEVLNYDAIKDFAGLVVWTRNGYTYNFTAVKLFAETKPVISDIFDFAYYLYPSLRASMQNVSGNLVTYVKDWGNFRNGDIAEMHNGTSYLTTLATSGLASFSNVTVIARSSSTRVALFQMVGKTADSGFYVMDLRATRSNSFEPGNWHLFPAISKVSMLSAGRYARWMTDGLSWRSIDWIYSWMTNFTAANNDVVYMRRIGTTVLGRAINALFIGKGNRYFIADGAIHGDEKSSAFGIIRFAELLVEWYRVSPSWQRKLTQYKVILIPVLNPDGYVANTRENANGRNLNRQFPPGGVTTEPEAWTLRSLMGNYTPTEYVNLHADGPSYPLYVFYPGLSVDPYRLYIRSAINEGNFSFKSLNHWGTVYTDVSVGKYNYIGPSGSTAMASEYAYYTYKAASVLTEHPSQNRPSANMHAQEFYITVMLSLLLHYDRTGGFMLQSNTFVTETQYSSPSLRITVDATYVAGDRTSSTQIRDLNGRGKPKLVYIDGVQKAEGNNWTWSSASNTTTVTGAENTIVLQW